MIRNCGICGAPVIRGREIDNAIRDVDRDPVPNGGAVLVGAVDDEPSVIWGVDPAGEEMPWGTAIPAGALRYRQHECPAGGLR